MMLDLDHFKAINDNYGHEAGDFVLQKAAKILKEIISEYGVIARYGGDEFVAMLTTQDKLVLDEISLKLSTAIQSINKYQNNDIRLDVSTGYCLSLEYKSVDKIVEKADQRMYKNKQAKKACR